MELSDSLIEVTLQDLQWAVDNNYDTDIKWVGMNVVSILSNKDKSKRFKNKENFRKLTGQPLYCPTSSPAKDWSGCYEDVLLATSKICKVSKLKVKQELDCFTHASAGELSIRLRYFNTAKRNPIYGESAYLKRDESKNLYMWDYDSKGKLIQVSEQYVKTQLLLWATHKPTLLFYLA